MCVCVPSSIKTILRLLFESMICYLLLLICPEQLIFEFAVSFRLSFSKTIYCERRNSTFFHLLKATTHFIIFTMRTSAETRSTVEDGNGFLPLQLVFSSIDFSCCAKIDRHKSKYVQIRCYSIEMCIHTLTSFSPFYRFDPRSVRFPDQLQVKYFIGATN